MEQKQSTIDNIATILCKAAKHVLESSTKKRITYSKTFQSIPKVAMKPEIGCFVQFSGDYNGLVVINFSAASAMELYTSYMTSMGIPENELAKEYTSNEVADSIGELTNQLMGLLMRTVEDKYDLSSFCGQPKALALNSAITLVIDADYRDHRRISMSVENHKFYIELAMESTEFVPTR